MRSGFVDVHVHPPTKEFLIEAGGKYMEAASSKFGQKIETKTIAEMLVEFDHAGVEKLVLLAWDAESTTGLPAVTNDFIAKIVNERPERFIGVAMVDPHRGKLAVKELERSVVDLKLRGLKLHPQAQLFSPNDEEVYPLYEKCVELGVPVIFHTGTTNWGAGMPGGGGVKLRYSDPMLIDDVAADFPELRILMAHPGWPWQDEQVAIAHHKANVYLDLSGWSPKYLQPILVTYMKKLIPDKVMFGTDYPMLTPSRWLKDLETLKLPEDTRNALLRDNAVKFFRI